MRLFALLLLIMLLPFILIVSLLIYLSSGYPIFFKQERVGKAKRLFTIYKFRTMKHNRITREGSIIRKTGLDEIPQLGNIIKGEMNFVGPRPLTKNDINRLGWHEKKFESRWSVKPGITGIAQLSKVCNAELSIKNDLYYVSHKSFLLDIRLILKSTLVPIFGKLTR